MNVIYERADLAALRDLNVVFAKAFEDPDSYQSVIPSDEYLGSLLVDTTFIPLVAVDDGVVTGGLAAYVLKKFEQERSEIYIYDLAVDESCRREGVATTMIEKLKEVAAKRG